jgi:hypothetical protein
MDADPQEERSLSRLLEYIDDMRDQECASIRNEARRDSRELLRVARREAAERVRVTITHLREDNQMRLLAARASSQERLRRARYRLARELLDGVWQDLGLAVRRRWRDREGRREWVGSALRQCSDRVLGLRWVLRHPSTWDPEEASDLIDAASSAVNGLVVELQPDGQLEAGVCISCGDVLVDATPDALLSRRSQIEGFLLGEIDRLQQTHDGPNEADPAKRNL